VPRRSLVKIGRQGCLKAWGVDGRVKRWWFVRGSVVGRAPIGGHAGKGACRLLGIRVQATVVIVVVNVAFRRCVQVVQRD
jgi:hypothetical protein